ncbi:MAG TPA: hypothetical protein ENJ35_10630, partial [Gammaproteobacteria bacterium]|nr:hypothetical protein [Gammaproteobacteria bacterium]
RRRTKFFHPDQFQKDPERRATADEFMPLVNEAYETLKDPVKRRRYDQERKKMGFSGPSPEVRDLVERLDEAYRTLAMADRLVHFFDNVTLDKCSMEFTSEWS